MNRRIFAQDSNQSRTNFSLKLSHLVYRNKFTFDENDDQSPISLSRQQSNDFHNDSSSATSSPKIFKRQAHLIKRSSSEIDPDEQLTVWHNLPKEVWKTAAEVNSPK